MKKTDVNTLTGAELELYCSLLPHAYALELERTGRVSATQAEALREDMYQTIAAAVSTLTLTYLGRDSWGRPVYGAHGQYYVDVDARAWRPACICTKHRNAFDGEPDTPLNPNLKLVFKPRRDVRELVGPVPLGNN